MKPEVTSDAAPPTIMIVDDTPANVGVLGWYFEENGFRVVVAQDGEEALERAHFVRPDLILLDVMMPGIDGFETCRRLKMMPEVKDIPVIFMTALSDTNEKISGFKSGGVDYVTKPCQIEEVLARVNTHLSLRAMQRKLEEQNRQLREESRERQRAEQSLNSSYAELKTTHDELEKLHQQLLQSEKMASIGQLAAGVAHEINNPIAFVNSNLGTLKEYVDDLWQLIDAYEALADRLADRAELFETVRGVREKLDIGYLRQDLQNLMTESLDGVSRVRRIVQDLKDFSHVGEAERQTFDLHAGIDSTLNIVWHELKQRAEVKKEYGDLPLVHGVPAQLNQVFMNLLINAAQAMDRFGAITIRTGAEDGWVWVEIADTGAGIQAEHLPHLFEPFFTTKPVGKGTGLGLSLSYGIVSQHGGRIEVDSEVGKGTVFRVWLPSGNEE
ncbi:MAG TPA: response regulator [Paucimonas sp.]|nr:response regulator [Paucimonas sp.]